MLIADMKKIGKIHNGVVSIGAIYYGQQLVWKKGAGFTTPYNREVECLLAKDTDTYIVTDIKIKDLTKYKFEIRGWCGLGATMLFGVRDMAVTGNAATNTFAMLHSANGQYQLRVMTGSTAGSLTINNTEPKTFIFDGANKTFTIEGVNVNLSSTSKADMPKVDSNYGLALFGCNSGGFVDNAGKDRCIYYFKVWYEDELIADYIPVIDNNGIPCMWDKVTEKLIKCPTDQGKFDFAEKGDDNDFYSI